MLLKIYLAGLLLSFLLTVLYYWLAASNSTVIDVIAALIIVSSSWIGVFLFILTIKATVYRTKEKRLEKLRRGEPFIDHARNYQGKPFTNEEAEQIKTRVKIARSVTKEQLN
jgi:hypothetical protein